MSRSTNRMRATCGRPSAARVSARLIALVHVVAVLLLVVLLAEIAPVDFRAAFAAEPSRAELSLPDHLDKIFKARQALAGPR